MATSSQNTYVNLTPYDEQLAELQRRQKMAEMLSQQANAPLETPQNPGRMISKISPVSGLAKMLQSYLAGSQLRDIEKQRGAAEEQARTGAMDWLDKFSQGKATPMSPDQALQASMSTEPTEPQRVPFTPTERNTELMRGAMGANPYTSKLASVLMAQKPATAPVKEVETDKYTPESIQRFTQSAQSGTPDYSLLVPNAEKPLAPHTTTIMRNGKPTVVDVVSNKEIGEAYQPPKDAPAPTIATILVNGVPTVIDARTGRPIGPAVKESKQPSDEQNKAAGFYERMKTANQQVEEAKYNPTRMQSAIGAIPYVGSTITNDEKKAFDQSRANFINALLRRESGAAIGASEFDAANKQYFPMPGDSETVLQQKKLNRQQAIDSMKLSAGNVPLSKDAPKLDPEIEAKIVQGKVLTLTDGTKWTRDKNNNVRQVQ